MAKLTTNDLIAILSSKRGYLKWGNSRVSEKFKVSLNVAKNAKKQAKELDKLASAWDEALDLASLKKDRRITLG